MAEHHLVLSWAALFKGYCEISISKGKYVFIKQPLHKLVNEEMKRKIGSQNS